MLELNPRSSVPLYAQLAERLLEQIRADRYPEGARIPSENELAKSYGVGRPTVRQATEVLERRGYLVRRRGAGTFVRAQSQSVDLFSLGGTLRSFREQGIELCMDWFSGPQCVLVTDDLQHPLSGREAYSMKRLGHVDHQGVLIETFWFDAAYFPGLDRFDLVGQSLAELTRREYRTEPTSADQRFVVEYWTSEDAELLGVEEGAAVLRVERTLHFATARGAVFAVMQCRTDQFEFSQTIGGPGPVETSRPKGE